MNTQIEQGKAARQARSVREGSGRWGLRAGFAAAGIAMAVFAVHAPASMVMPMEVDASTIALWRFDEVVGTGRDTGFVFADASGNNYGYVETAWNENNQLSTVPGLFGRAVTGFITYSSTHLGLDMGNTPTGMRNHASHTIEAWIRWDAENLLPQNLSTGQKLLDRLSGSGGVTTGKGYVVSFGTSSEGDAELRIRFYDRRNIDPETAHFYIDETFLVNLGKLDTDAWYHVAVSAEVGLNLNDSHPEGGSGDDVRVRAYFNGVDAMSATPDPDAVFIVYDTGDAVRPNGVQPPDWTFRTGRPWGAFRGQIDEMRFSNVARTEFPTLIPEPGTIGLLGLSGLLLLLRRRLSA